MTEIFPVSKLFSITTIQGFLLRYVTLFQDNWLRNGRPAKFEVRKKSSNSHDLCSKMHDFPECFSDFELCRPAISKPVVLEKSDIPQKKALNSGN